MKIQFGLLHLDGRPAGEGDWPVFPNAPVAEIAGKLIEGSLLIGYRGDRITEEEDFETQPLRSGDHIITFDGRLDNRSEIAIRITLPQWQSVPDPVLVMKGYEKFGDSIFAELIGEFALTLWSGLSRSLTFVRSACGARTLYYVLAKNTLYWSSDFALLVRVSRVDLTINDDYVIKYLVSPPPARETPLKNVATVPPNHIVHFENRGFKRCTEMWDPTRVSPVRCRTDAEYEELFRIKIKETVAARLRAKHPVFSELSGGLDSSSIVLTADHILRETGAPPDRLQTVSCIYDQSTTCDERRFIELVAQQRGIPTHVISEKDQQISTGLEGTEFTGVPNPLHCFPGRYSSIAAIMRSHDARVLLTGLGGDHLFWSDPDGAAIVADALCNGSFFRAHAECRTWSRCSNTPYYELLFGRAVPLTVQSLIGGKSSFKMPEIPSWLHPSRRAQCVFPDSEFDGFHDWHCGPSRRSQVFVLDNLFRLTGSGLFAEYQDLYVSHPYSHRPLIEFCLGTPIGQFLRNGETRSLMRRALRDALPVKVTKRRSKGLVDEAIVRALQREWPRDIFHWKTWQHQLVRNALVLEALNKGRLGIIDSAGPLVRLLSLERWLRSLRCAKALQMQT